MNEFSASKDLVSLASGDDPTVKTLDFQWYPGSEKLAYGIRLTTCSCTKYGLPSAVTMIYYPMRYISPSVVIIKILIQQLGRFSCFGMKNLALL